MFVSIIRHTSKDLERGEDHTLSLYSPLALDYLTFLTTPYAKSAVKSLVFNISCCSMVAFLLSSPPPFSFLSFLCHYLVVRIGL